MAELTDLSDIINRLTGGYSGSPQTIFFFKRPFSLGATYNASANANSWQSLWLVDGAPSGGLIPTTAETCTNSTIGGLRQNNPSVGQQQWLTNFAAQISNNNGMTLLYDRLIQMGGLSATSTAVQNVNLTGLTRYSGTSSVGNMIFVEVYSNIGTTARNLTITYTNQNGVSGRTTTISIGSSTGNTVGSAWIPNLASGDTGVQSVQSVQLAASTTTTGNFGVSIIRPIILTDSMVNIPNNQYTVIGVPSVPEIQSNACLALAIILTATSSGAEYVNFFNGHVQLINK